MELTGKVCNKLINDMANVLSERDYDYTEDALQTIVDEWYRQKSKWLIPLFEKSPYWDADNLTLRVKTAFCREIGNQEIKTIRNFYSFIASHIDESVNLFMSEIFNTDDEYCDFVRFAIRAFRYLEENAYYIGNNYTRPLICESEVEYYTNRLAIGMPNKYVDRCKPHEGSKTSRFISKLCKTLGFGIKPEEVKNISTKTIKETYENGGYEGELQDKINLFLRYERDFAQFGDAINPCYIEYPTFLSLNPIDYLYMSNGNNWTSCHDIRTYGRQGEYSSGTLSYMLDECTFIVYTLKNEYEAPQFERKITRGVFCYDHGVLLQSRLYPQHNDGNNSLYNDIRNVVQSMISQCENVPNTWKLLSDNNTQDYFYTNDRATHYRDYEYYQYRKVSTLNAIDTSGITLEIGAAPICPNCGDRHDDNTCITCYNCNGTHRCADCGALIDEDDVIWVDGEPYCNECVDLCEECNQYFVNSQVNYIHSLDRYVCDECLERYYTQCCECGDYIPLDDCYTTIDGDNVCDDCAREYYTVCENCGVLVFYKDSREGLDGAFYCIDCWDDIYTTCAECGCVIEIEDSCLDNSTGVAICKDCYNATHEDTEEREEVA